MKIEAWRKILSAFVHFLFSLAPVLHLFLCKVFHVRNVRNWSITVYFSLLLLFISISGSEFYESAEIVGKKFFKALSMGDLNCDVYEAPLPLSVSWKF